MLNRISKFTGYKKVILIIFLILSFALLKSYNPIATHSVNGIFLSLLFILAYGIFYWLLFEVMVSFFYGALKTKIESKISMDSFLNIFRAFIILSNIIIFIFTKILILLNFYTVFLLLLFNIAFSFFIMCLIYVYLKKHYFKEIANKSFCTSYFGFIFVYLFLLTMLWGVI